MPKGYPNPYDPRVAALMIARHPEDARRLARRLWATMAMIKAGDAGDRTRGEHITGCLVRRLSWTQQQTSLVAGRCADCDHRRDQLVRQSIKLAANLAGHHVLSWSADSYYGVTLADGQRCEV